MKIKFLKDREEKAAKGRTFKKDEVYDVPDASGNHWINRGVAVQVADLTRATKPYEAGVETAVKAAAPEESPADTSPVSETNAAEAIETISRMRSEDRLNHVISGDKRATVVEAAKKRLAEIKGA